MFTNEIDYWKALSVENPDAGEKETEPAGPSELPAGGNDADPAKLHDDVEDIAQDDDANTAKSEEPEDNPETEPEEKAVQSKHERAKQAAARRKREQDAAIQAAVDAALQRERAESDRKIKDLLKGMGLKDPNNGNKLIETIEEYQSYQSQQALKNAEAELKRGKLTPETLQQVVGQMPELQQARQVLARAEAEKAAAERQRVQQQVAADIAEITKLDPTITDLESLLRSEGGTEIYALAKKDVDLATAYKVVNIDKLTQRAASAARAQKANSEQSRQHLKPTTTRGQGGVEVPGDIAKLYREMNPGMSDADIRKSYEAYLKRVK